MATLPLGSSYLTEIAGYLIYTHVVTDGGTTQTQFYAVDEYYNATRFLQINNAGIVDALPNMSDSVNINGIFYVETNGGNGPTKIYATDGTATGTSVILSAPNASTIGSLGNILPVDGKTAVSLLTVTTGKTVSGSEPYQKYTVTLYSTTGTGQPGVALAHVTYGTPDDSTGGISLLASVNGEAFFTTTTEKMVGKTDPGGQNYNQYHTTIYVTDGSVSSTQALLNISFGASDTVTGVTYLGAGNGNIYFSTATQQVAADGSPKGMLKTTIYVSNGTAAGTTVFSGYTVAPGSEVASSGNDINNTIFANYEVLVVSAGGVAEGNLIFFTDLVESGGITSQTVLFSSSTENVYAGGKAVSTIIYDGGEQLLYNGGTASSTIVYNGGEQYVEGGAATSTTLFGGGRQNIFSGTATDTTLSGGQQDIETGIANNTTVASNGLQAVGSGGTSSGGVINKGGVEIALPGATVVSVTLNAGGVLVDVPGAVITGTVFDGGTVATGGVVVSQPGGLASYYGNTLSNLRLAYLGTEYVLSGGVDSASVISAGADQIVYGLTEATQDFGSITVFSGGVTSGAMLKYEGSEVLSGGRAYATVIDGGSLQTSSGNQSFNTVVNGGSASVAGGVSSGTIVRSGGTEYLNDQGQSFSTVISNGGIQDVTNATANNTVVSAGGTQFVYTDGIANGTNVLSGGTLIALPGAKVTDTVANGGHVVSSGVINFVSSTDIKIYASKTANISVNSGGILYALDGGTVTKATVNAQGELDVLSGGAAVNVVDDGYISYMNGNNGISLMQVYSGGTATGTNELFFAALGVAGSVYKTTVGLDSTMYVGSGGVASQTTLGEYSQVTVASGGVAYRTTLADGSEGQLNLRGGIIEDTTIGSYGGEVIVYSGTAINTTVNSGGGLSIEAGNGSIKNATLNGGGIGVGSGATATGTISFGTLGGQLDDANSQASLNISGFANASPGSSIIYLTNVSIAGSTQVTLGASGTLSIGGVSINFAGDSGMVVTETETAYGTQIIETTPPPASADAANAGIFDLTTKTSMEMAAILGRSSEIPFLATSHASSFNGVAVDNLNTHGIEGLKFNYRPTTANLPITTSASSPGASLQFERAVFGIDKVLGPTYSASSPVLTHG